MSTAHRQFKMTDVTDTRMKQRVATEFLTAEEVSSIEIRTGLNSVCVGSTPLV
jgi:hypothetical protein